MKKLSYLFLLLVGIWLAGCDDSSEASLIPEIIPTEQGSDTYVMKGYESSDNGFNVYKPKAIGTPFYIQSKAFTGRNYAFAPVNSESLEGLTVVPSADAFSESVEVKPSTCYWVRFNRYNHYQMGKLRVAYIHGNEVGIEYVASEDIDVKNANIADNNKADNLEIPALNATNQYIEYYAGVSDEEGAGQVLNFSLEYIASKKHSAWVAFSFDPITAQDNVKRANEWNQDDPNIDNSVEVTESMHKSDGYDKGHLCASEDRVYSKSANKQTFYYSNISPQIGSFNQKYWAALEKQVQTWGRSTINGIYDKLYVVKGGTTDRLLTNFTGVKKANDGLYPTTNADGLTLGGLICPSYYYMALLSEKAGVYHTIAFLVPHSELLPEKPGKDEFMVYAVSIKNLEYETGIDFFCNLPNEIEKTVEATYSADDWAW